MMSDSGTNHPDAAPSSATLSSTERAASQDAPAVPGQSPPPRLGLWDAVSIIVGIVVGVSIFKTPQYVFQFAGSSWLGLTLWAAGGLLSLAGALCYAELATTYPRLGGDYVYLTRAFGGVVGFLFGWANLTVVLTGGSIGVVSYAFGDYAVQLWGLNAASAVWFALASVAGLSLLNIFGVVLGKLAQNVLTVAKVLGLAGIVVAGFLWSSGEPAMASRASGLNIGLAMIFVLYAFGGWNDAAFVAAEVRDRRRNVPRALIYGTGAITLIYLIVNAAYLWGLGYEGLRASSTPAADVLEPVLGAWGSRGMSLLVMISALGAVNGLIFAGSRVYATLGEDYGLFAALSRWHYSLGSPIWSILAQCGISILYILLVGTQRGRDLFDGALNLVTLPGLPWDEYYGGFDTLVAGTAPIFWSFFLLTGLAVFVLRFKDPDRTRPFSVPLYPLTPILFCATSAYMLYSSLDYAKWLCLLGILPTLVGIPLYFLSGRKPTARWVPSSDDEN